MVSYFPKPYDDELLYSVIARYQIHTGQLEDKVVLDDLFGVRTVAAVPDLPSHLNSFSKKVQRIWKTSSDDLIRQHTLAPIYLAFSPESISKKTKRSMKSDFGGDVHTRLGIVASKVKTHKYLQYCEICRKNQIENLGEPYWQRTHQLTSVRVCHIHGTPLVLSDVKNPPPSKHLFASARNTKKHKEQPLARDLKAKEQQFARLCHSLLDCPPRKTVNRWQWSQFYDGIAKSRGFRIGNRTDYGAIGDAVLSYWGRQGLELLCANFDMDKGHVWLKNIFRKHKKSFHYTHHIALWTALYENPDPHLLIEEASRLPKAPSKPVIASSPDLPINETLKAQRRQKWLNLVGRNPAAGVKELRSLPYGAATYGWLYRNDRDWLQNHTPAKAKPVSTHSTVCWAERDEETVEQLRALIDSKALLATGRRLSRSYIIRNLPKPGMVEKNLAKLPKSCNFLDRNSETVEQFQSRRLWQAARSLHRSSTGIVAWRLRKYAGLKSGPLSPHIESLIAKLVSLGPHESQRLL